MKRLVLVLSAVAAFTGSAVAADLPAGPYTKAAPVMAAPAPNWTGCYVGGGGGYGLWNQENTGFDDPATTSDVRTQSAPSTTSGGRGWFGTVQGGCDYQFGQQFVIGAQADYDFSSLKGQLALPTGGPLSGEEKQTSAWGAGGRIGWLALPSLLTYISAGYTEARFGRVDFTQFGFSSPVIYFNSQTYHGWYLGAGDEYALSFMPGLFWKTEYRIAEYNLRTNPLFSSSDGITAFQSVDSRKWVQTVRSELVYRFNWGNPLVTRY